MKSVKKVFSYNLFRLLFSLVFLLCISFNFVSAEKIEDLEAKNYINDYANIIDDNVEQKLNQELYDYEASTTNQLSVFTVNDIDGDYIEHFSIKLAEKIKLGTEKQDNGILILISKNDRKMRIEVGYGLEPVITDGISTKIINEILTPNFKKGDYTTGVDLAVGEIIKIASDTKYAEEFSKTSSSKFSVDFSSFFILLIFILLSWFASVLARTKSWWLGGVIGAVIGIVLLLIAGFSLVTFVISVVLSLFGFLFDFLVSKDYKQSVISGTSPVWWSGGSWGPGSGSSSNSSFGGGGGGSFGGGGSSGSW